MKLKIAHGKELDFSDGPLVMGILNVTPDSFSDGGVNVASPVETALAMVEAGAAIIDIGGESTRPGYTPVPLKEELARVLPALRGIRQALPEITISIDTMKAGVAEAALAEGADIINDVTAFEHEPEAMCRLLAESRAGCILMHSVPLASKGACTDEVVAYLKSRVEWACRQTGMDEDYFAVDVGIGFGKSVEQNLELAVANEALHAIGRPVLLGISRKSVLGAVTGRLVSERGAATVAAVAVAAFTGADILRVHDVKSAVDAVKVAKALRIAASGLRG
ncbi:MAG: dihydropteroate synthase [Victivallales bacterium]|nr:dihydropteroate synthase [Victivallales bacterium]